jgi:hypothetical protein
MERLLKRPVKCLGDGEEHMLGPEEIQDTLFDTRTSSVADLIKYYANMDGQELLTVFLCDNYRGHSSFLMVRKHTISFLNFGLYRPDNILPPFIDAEFFVLL